MLHELEYNCRASLKALALASSLRRFCVLCKQRLLRVRVLRDIFECNDILHDVPRCNSFPVTTLGYASPMKTLVETVY